MLNKKVTKTLLYEKVIKHIMESINNGEISPGDRFPTERDLVEKMGISRNVLREAFHILEDKGLIISIQGKGRYLRELPLGDFHPKDIVVELEKCSLLEIYEVRKMVELNCMELVIKNAEEEDIRDIEKVYNDLAAEFLKKRSTVGEFQMHMAYAEKTKNYYLKQVLALTLNLILKFMKSTFNKVVDEYELNNFIQDHGEIIECIKERNTEKAKQIMEMHLDRTKLDINKFD